MDTLLLNTERPAEPPLNLAAVMGAQAWQRLPAAVQRRFAAGHADVTYRGHMDLRCSCWGRVFAWLTRPLRAPLCAQQARNLPAEVSVRADGHGGVVWTRHLGAQTVQSTKRRHPERGLWECTTGGLSMALDVFEERGTLVFQSRRYWWLCGPLHLPLPNWLGPGRCRVTHEDLGGRRFRFTLVMQHPVLGETFHQTGVFDDPHGD